ncbi:MAG: hypothetical protein ACQETI_10900 [Halobacteriota archaeon]
MGTVQHTSSVVSLDADTALEAALTAVDGLLYFFVEYTAQEFNTMYVDEAAIEWYGGPEQVLEHVADIYSYVHLDFVERDLFERHLFSKTGRVRTLITGMDEMTLVRLLADDEGLFLSVDSATDAQGIVDAVTRSM